MFSELEGFLEDLRGIRFVYVPNSGNAGDSFIAHATYQLFDRLGLDYEVGSEFCQYPGRLVVCGGGGNLVPMYDDLKDFLIANAEDCRRIILLPHTIQGNEGVLSKLGANCEIFCRDRMSYDFVCQHATRARVWLSHDLAFSTDLELTTKHGSNLPVAFQPSVAFMRRTAKRVLLPLHYKASSFGGSKVLNCFRRDRERTALTLPTPNIDVSAVYATGVMTKVDALRTTYRMVRFVGRFATINTNRLHIAILGAILGRKVNFYPNSYGKNRAVFQHSIAGRFQNVTWCG